MMWRQPGRLASGLVVALLMVATLGALLALVVQRSAEAARARIDVNLASEFDGQLHYELMHDMRATLQRMADEAGPGRPAPAVVRQRAAQLRAAGFLVDVPQPGPDGGLVHSQVLASDRVPAVPLQTLWNSTFRLARTGDGTYVIPLGRTERNTIARLLGTIDDVVGAVVLVTEAQIERAARTTMFPLDELTYYPGSRVLRPVRVSASRDGKVRVDTLEGPPDTDAQEDEPGRFGWLDRGANWPGFLLWGGRESPHYRHREEQRDGRTLQVVYVRDLESPELRWHGYAAGLRPDLYSPVQRLSPWTVGLGALLLLAAWVLVIRWIVPRQGPLPGSAPAA